MLGAWIRGWWRRLRRGPAGIGAAGEAAAADFLRREHGFRVLARNWRHGRDELDLVCLDGGVLVFVEVKTRAAGALVGGYEAVDARKKRALRRAALAYLVRLDAPPVAYRFDVVEVRHRDGRSVELHHFENIPLFGPHHHRAG